jgi:hypothetical protein
MKVRLFLKKQIVILLILLSFISFLSILFVKGFEWKDSTLGAHSKFPRTFSNLSKGNYMNVTYKVKSGSGMDLYILSEAEYTKFNAAQSFTAHITRDNSLQGNILFEIPLDGNWVVLIDNTDSNTAITYDLTVDILLVNPYFWIQVVIIIVVISAIVAGVVVVAVFLVKKRKKGKITNQNKSKV